LSFEQRIQFYVQAAQVNLLLLHHGGKSENTRNDKKQQNKNNGLLIHAFSLSAQ
jgi:hypothetical protein